MISIRDPSRRPIRPMHLRHHSHAAHGKPSQTQRFVSTGATHRGVCDLRCSARQNTELCVPTTAGTFDFMPRSRSYPLRTLTEGLNDLDRRLFDAVAESPSPLLDLTMRPLSSAADHSKLWVLIAAGLGSSGKLSMRRGGPATKLALVARVISGRRLASHVPMMVSEIPMP